MATSNTLTNGTKLGSVKMFHGRINANQITASKIVTIFSHKVEIQAKATQIKNAGTAHNDSRNANTATTDKIN
jgi:hypothetical protein